MANIGDLIPLHKRLPKARDLNDVIRYESNEIPGFTEWENIIYPNLTTSSEFLEFYNNNFDLMQLDRGTERFHLWAQWAFPDDDLREDFFRFFNNYSNSEGQINGNVTLPVVLENPNGFFDRYKDEDLVDYNELINLLNPISPVSQMMAWTEIFLADRVVGLTLLSFINDVSAMADQVYNNAFAMRVIMDVEDDFPMLVNYKVKKMDIPYSAFNRPLVSLLGWIEFFLSDYEVGMNRFEYFLQMPSITEDIVDSFHVMSVMNVLADTVIRNYRTEEVE